jgi:transposase-like protein
VELLPVNRFGNITVGPRVALLLCLATPLAAAAPQWQGLRVSRESIASIESVNGVPLHIERFAGRDVPELLRRWLAEWRADERTAGQSGGRSGGWRVHARLLRPATQEVLQVRGQGDASELLWSRLGLSDRSPNAPGAMRLPADCRSGPRVQGRDAQGTFEISSGVCRRAPPHVRARSCVLEADGNSLCVVPLPGADVDSANALVFLRRKAAGAGR